MIAAVPRRILVVDDEPLARQRVVRLVSASGLAIAVEEARNGLEALEKLRGSAFDVVLLDVEMPGLSGLDVLRQLPGRTFRVVFQTAFDRYAVDAFEAAACDYLVKPFTADRLRSALERALTQVADGQRLATLEERLTEREGALRRLAVRVGRRLVLAEEGDVVAVVSRDHVSCVHLANGTEGTTDLSLASLAERLDPGVFPRLHRAHLVNAAHVTSLFSAPDGELRVVLTGGLELPVSRRSRAAARVLAAEERVTASPPRPKRRTR